MVANVIAQWVGAIALQAADQSFFLGNPYDPQSTTKSNPYTQSPGVSLEYNWCVSSIPPKESCYIKNVNLEYRQNF